jgi:DNA damage-binding protein 1
LYNTLGNEHYLLGGLGDGHLVIWRFDPASRQLSQRKRVPLATQPGTTRTCRTLTACAAAAALVGPPIACLTPFRTLLAYFYPFLVILHPFRSGNTTHVFACCDRPTVIYAVPTTGKLVYSNVNLREVAHMCSFSTEAFTGTLHPSACRSPSPSPVYARPRVGQLTR